MADHLTRTASIGFQVQRGTNNAQPKPTRPFHPNGVPVTNVARGGNPQGIITGAVRK